MTEPTVTPTAPRPQFSLRLIFGVTAFAAVMFSLSRWSASHVTERAQWLMVSIFTGWSVALVAQLLCTVWAFPLLRYTPPGPLSKRKRRARRALNVCFGVGLAPLVACVGLQLALVAEQHDWFDQRTVVRIETLLIGLTLFSATLKLIAGLLYCGWRSARPVVWMRATMFVSAAYPALVVLVGGFGMFLD